MMPSSESCTPCAMPQPAPILRFCEVDMLSRRQRASPEAKKLSHRRHKLSAPGCRAVDPFSRHVFVPVACLPTTGASPWGHHPSLVQRLTFEIRGVALAACGGSLRGAPRGVMGALEKNGGGTAPGRRL